MEKAREAGDFASRIDLTKFDCEGLKALDEHTLQITIRGKYPQFDNWMAMAFFAPMPWEAEAFYANPGFAENNISLDTWPVGTGHTCSPCRGKTESMCSSAIPTIAD